MAAREAFFPGVAAPEHLGRRWAGPVAWAAGLWGTLVFLPVGMNYLALIALTLAMAGTGQREIRLQRVRQHALFLPLMVFLAWTCTTLLLQPRFYAETPSNLMHGLRIVLTWTLALALSREEALWALRGFVLAAAVSVLVIALGHTLGLPQWDAWRNLLEYSGNKSISNALLFATLAGSCVVLALELAGRRRALACVGAALLLGVIILALPNRTSLLILLCAAPLALLHRWRAHKSRLAASLVVAALVSTLFVALVPEAQTRLAQGISEARKGAEGQVANASWNLRVQMIRYTGQMMRERPLTGWGIGSWNSEWRRRVPAQIADLNMPHDDFLWMGAQAGLPGALSWLYMMLAACWLGWRRRDAVGRLAFVAAVGMLASALANSATRDAVIGLSLLWIVAVYVRLASEPAVVVSGPGVSGGGAR